MRVIGLVSAFREGPLVALCFALALLSVLWQVAR